VIPGIHVSTAGGIEKAPARLRGLGLEAGQVFTANQRRWISPPLKEKSVETFRNETGELLFVSHASYLINPASSREDVREMSAAALKDELNRCIQLRIPRMVLHPGAHQGAGPREGIKMVAQALKEAVDATGPGPVILLENTAGAGTTLGRSLQELAEIRDLAGMPERTGYCIDTAHAHGAGYDVGNADFSRAIQAILGAENVKVFHMNGSKVEKGSLRDRHEHFSCGTIALSGLMKLYNDPAFEKTLGIAETPGSDQDRAADMGMLEREGAN
jgi:deoxyribonuclease-4